MRSALSIALAALVLCAGATPALAAGTHGGAPPPGPADARAETGVDADVEAGPPAQTTGGDRPDPANDTLGWENGYWYNETIDVNQDDGLTDAEIEAYVARAMARVEQIRQKEFQEDVPVSIVTRAEYRNRSTGGGGSDAETHWNDQVWEGLFIIGENKDSAEVLNTALGSSVAGYYSPTDDQIKIVTDSPDQPVIDNATLVHELTHALQDQHYNLSRSRFTAETQDGELAIDGLIEGSANYVEDRYASKCRGVWQCVATPATGAAGGGGGSDLNYGVLFTLLQPYSDGPVYVHNLIERNGWSAVDRRFANPPVSSEQIIHTTGESPAELPLSIQAENGWSQFENRGVNGADTVGEASIFTMLWYQAYEYGAQTVSTQAFFDAAGPYDTYDYAAEASAGWGNDKLVPYHKGSGENAKYGYVWATEWDTQRDAAQFRDAYRQILAAHDAEARGENLYVIPDGSFADAFRVAHNGTRVTIVNGPSPQAVRNLYPAATAAGGNGGGDGGDTGGETDTSFPGFGPVTAALALTVVALAAALIGRRRR